MKFFVVQFPPVCRSFLSLYSTWSIQHFTIKHYLCTSSSVWEKTFHIHTRE